MDVLSKEHLKGCPVQSHPKFWKHVFLPLQTHLYIDLLWFGCKKGIMKIVDIDFV